MFLSLHWLLGRSQLLTFSNRIDFMIYTSCTNFTSGVVLLLKLTFPLTHCPQLFILSCWIKYTHKLPQILPEGRLNMYTNKIQIVIAIIRKRQSTKNIGRTLQSRSCWFSWDEASSLWCKASSSAFPPGSCRKSTRAQISFPQSALQPCLWNCLLASPHSPS